MQSDILKFVFGCIHFFVRQGQAAAELKQRKGNHLKRRDGVRVKKFPASCLRTTKIASGNAAGRRGDQSVKILLDGDSFLNELTFTLFNYREAGVMGAESRVAVDREGKHPIVEVPIRTNDGGHSKQWKTTKTILKTTLQENETALTPDIAILVSRVYFLLSDVIKRLPEV